MSNATLNRKRTRNESSSRPLREINWEVEETPDKVPRGAAIELEMMLMSLPEEQLKEINAIWGEIALDIFQQPPVDPPSTQ